MTTTLESVRPALVDYAMSCVGLSAHPSNSRAAFGRAVAPFGPPAWVASLCAPTPPNAANSTCEVFGVATEQEVARRLGIAGHDHPLDAGGATAQWAREVALANRLGAFRTIAKDGPPTIGALVHVEGPSSRHWYRVVGGTPGAGPFDTVDGGQNDRGYQAIARCRRQIRGDREVLATGTEGRLVVDWIDSPALLVALARETPAPRPETTSPAASFVPPPPASPAPAPLDMPTLRRGSIGAVVARWQRVVGATADGTFGRGTEAKTRAWQAAHGLVVDGVVGPATWRAALGSAAPAGPAPTTSTAATAQPLGTLPWVQGLIECEQREPGTCRALLEVGAEIPGVDVDRLCALISEECGWRPNLPPNPIGAVGLLQWLPAYAPLFGATAEQIGKMSAIEQIRGPLRATLLRRSMAGRADPAMAGWGNSMDAPDTKVIATARAPFPALAPSAAFYRLNAIYDLDKDGDIEAGELRASVYGRLTQAATKPRIGADGKPVTR